MSGRHRRNSEVGGYGDNHKYSSYQYATRHGPVPASTLHREAQKAPPHDPNKRTASGFPHAYHNREGTASNPHQIFEQYETSRPGPGPSSGLREMPVGVPRRPHNFDYHTKPAPASKVDRVPPPGQRAAAVGVAHPGASTWSGARTRPLNDAGPLRGVVMGLGTARDAYAPVGMMEHPPGNRRGFEAVRREPVDRLGRQEMNRYGDAEARSGYNTYPPRSGDAEEYSSMEERHRRRYG